MAVRIIAGFLLVLLIYLANGYPNYHTVNHLEFVQTLYGRRVFKIVVNCTLVMSILVIVIGIVVLITNEEDWFQYIVAADFGGDYFFETYAKQM